MKNRRSRAQTNALAYLILSGAIAALQLPLIAQTAPSAPAQQSGSESSENIIELSPFVVSTDKDQGYRATNSISGTRLDTPIKDLPMPIEVITRQFIDDTGSTDLRQALRYSSGVILQSQNDLSNSGGAYQGPGGVNNPEHTTANPNSVQVKLRGFITDNALRDGFIRQNSTDSVNVDRVEVVRGPAALLYGTGNFGGVVNYLVRRPSAEHPSQSFDVTYGSHDLLRGQFDMTGPLGTGGKWSYRISGAAQKTGDHTEHFGGDHYFVSPSLLWKPTSTTEVLLDLELGDQNLSGIGARQVRSVADVGVNNDQNEHGGLYTPPGANPRTYRLTGPDTFMNTEASNFLIKFTQQIYPGVNFLAGYNRSTYDLELRDVSAQLFTNVGPASLRQTINLRPLDPNRGTGSLNIQNGQVPGSILQYSWFGNANDNTRDQVRAELTAKFPLFRNSKWLRFENQFLGGYSEISHKLETENLATLPGGFNYRAPNDLSPLTFARQGDGSPTRGLFRSGIGTAESWNKALYLSYQGRFLDDRLLVLVGGRRDTNDRVSNNTGWTAPDATPTNSTVRGTTQREKSYQKGVSFELRRELSVYALESEGLQPNFSGQLLPDTGAPAGASLAKSEEIGIKFDLFEGRVSGTISRYKITKTGYVQAPWYSAVTLGAPRFDPSKDIVYNLSNFTPTGFASNGGAAYRNTGLPTLDQPAVVSAWNAAVASGAAWKDAAGTWRVNASRPQGAAYLDTAFATIDGDNGAAWPGFLYMGEATGDPLTNTATLDTMAFHGGGSNQAALLLTDESEGWDAQFLIKATDNLEIVVGGAITEVQRINFGQWMKYPHRQDRWSVWNFNNGSWGTLGLPRSTIYGDPGSGTTGPATETRTGAGQAAGDDTPKYRYDFWANYRFDDGALKGLSVGLGGYWESKRQYMSGVTHGSGQLIIDGNGQLLVLYTPERYNFDAMLRYDWKSRRGNNQYLQLNVSNVLDDRDLYGLIYASPMSAKLTYGIRF